tara:strand:+ start:315 stop:887 length:573 start_codon:yes stop_codon:yes gene_type:complete
MSSIDKKQRKLNIQKYQKDFPLKGTKIQLRSFVESDISSEYISWLNDKNIVRYSNQRFISHSFNSVTEYFNSFKYSPNLFLTIEDLITKHPVGTMTLHVQPFHRTVDVGILLGKPGNGFGKEAWCLAIVWLIEVCSVRKVTAGCLSSNLAMIRLMQSSGMYKDGTRISQELVDNTPQDIVYYAKFQNDKY